MMEYRIYAGTYAGADENGIFRYRMDGNSQIRERELALPGISTHRIWPFAERDHDVCSE